MQQLVALNHMMLTFLLNLLFALFGIYFAWGHLRAFAQQMRFRRSGVKLELRTTNINLQYLAILLLSSGLILLASGRLGGLILIAFGLCDLLAYCCPVLVTSEGIHHFGVTVLWDEITAVRELQAGTRTELVIHFGSAPSLKEMKLRDTEVLRRLIANHSSSPISPA